MTLLYLLRVILTLFHHRIHPQTPYPVNFYQLCACAASFATFCREEIDRSSVRDLFILGYYVIMTSLWGPWNISLERAFIPLSFHSKISNFKILPKIGVRALLPGTRRYLVHTAAVDVNILYLMNSPLHVTLYIKK